MSNHKIVFDFSITVNVPEESVARDIANYTKQLFEMIIVELACSEEEHVETNANVSSIQKVD